ncbi:MAG: hypothetical protein ACYDBZ_11700 [Steroidobacteraceae bacterium]
MKSKLRCNLPGTFLTRNLGQGRWRLSRGEPEPVEVFVLGAAAPAAGSSPAPEVRDIDLEWRADSVWLKFISDARPIAVQAQGAIVHEPLPGLYAALPLACLEEPGRRFWRRVFRLVRIPGGRYLLGVLARRSRGPH